MNSIKILTQMLELQQRLNDDTNGIGWEKGFTKEGKLISWRRCIYMECAELIDSFAWKHWKNIAAPTNWNNVRIEIVDIWHFIMSLLLEERGVESYEKVASELACVMRFKDFCKEASEPNENASYEILNDIELIIHKCSGFGFNMGELLNAYFTLAIKCGLNLELIYKIYIGKNVLNAFRQNNGYKDGSYKKLWNGREDNEVLNEILAKLEGEELEYDKIYQKLDGIYKNLTNS